MNESLIGIVYTSRATVPFDLAAVDALALRSWTANSDRSLTGYMNYREGRFVQYLEGPAEALNDVYGRISKDARHHIDFTQPLEVADRRFPAWFMEHLQLSTNDETTTAVENALVDAMAADPDDAAAMRATLARLIDRVADMYVASIM